jgi:NAD(P)-dependent dehydrogenase (short-subunit alcohol dehydrogenase family)
MRIIVTGASRGIGYHTALELVKAPNNYVLALSRDVDKLQDLQKATQKLGTAGRFHFLALDLTQTFPSSLFEKIEIMGGVDVLVNNAGQLINKPFLNTPLDDWQSIFEHNLFAPVRLIQALTPFLEKSQNAHILNISSMGGFQGSSKFSGLAAYSASKAALVNLTECLAEELKEKTIAVNCLALGAVQTEMLAAAFPGYVAPVSSEAMGTYVADFALNGHKVFNGKVLPVSVSTP